jgi:hypothetical protein
MELFAVLVEPEPCVNTEVNAAEEHMRCLIYII